MSVVRPQTPTDPFPITSNNPGFFLALRLDEIVRAADEDATSRLWKLFNSCVNELEQGKRLENLSWRTWSRERTIYSRQQYSRVPLLDDEADSQSPTLTEDDDDGDGDSSSDSSGSDDGSDDDQSRQQQQQQQQQHTNHLALVPSETVLSPVVAAATTITATAATAVAAVAPVVVATAVQSTTGSQQQQHPPLVSTPNSSSHQPRQPRRHHNHHQCSASHPATATHPKLLVNPPSRRHYSHSLPHTAVAAAAAAASASPPIGQLIRTVIFNQSAIMMTMTHNSDRAQHPPILDLSNTTPKLHAATLSALSKPATPAPTHAPTHTHTPTAPSISASLTDRPLLTITESTPLPSVEPTPLPTPKSTGLSPFPCTVPAPLGCPDVQAQASDSHSAPVTTRRALNPSTGHHPISHHRMFYLQYHSPDGSSSGGSHNSHAHLTPPTPGLPPSQNPPELPQISPSHVEAHRARSNGAGATRMSARKGKDSVRHGHVTPRNTSGRTTAKIVHHHYHSAGARKGVMTALTPGSASSGTPRKAPRRLAETVEQREVDDEMGRVGVIGPDLHMQKQHQVQQVGRDTPQRQVQFSHQSRSEPGTSTFTTPASTAEAGNTNPSSSQTAVQDIKVKNLTGPMMRLITPGLFDGDKVKPEVLDQRVDAALKAALNGATGNQRRRIKLVSSSEHESDDDDDDGESSWSDDESNEGERRHQQHQGPPHRSPPPSARRGSQTTESEDESDDNGDDDEHDGPLARAAKEAERQRNMFAKLPRESYADLRRKGIGAGPSNLTLLLNPPPEIFPHEHPYRILSRQSRSAGDIADHQHGGFGYGSQVQEPSHALYQYQQQQQRGYGQPQQQLGPMQRQKSQPSYGNGQCPTQFAVAPPPQPRQRHVTPVQAQAQDQPHLQQPSAKPPTRERVGGFGGFQFTVMHPVNPKAPKQPTPAPDSSAQRLQQVVVAPPPSAAPRRASTGASRVASTPPVLLSSLSKSSVLSPIIQQVTASSFKDALPARSAHYHEETELSPKRATVSPRGARPGNRLSAKPDDIELSESEDEGPELAIPSPKSMIKSPKSPMQEGGGAKAQLEALMSGKLRSPVASNATVVATEGLRFVDEQEPGAPIEFSESVVPLRAPPSTPSRGTETCVNGEHLPRSPTTVRAEHPRPHLTYGTLTNCHESPPPSYPEHAHAGVPSTSEPTCGNNSNNNAPIYPQPIEMPYPYNLPFPTHMLSPRTTRLKMLSSEMPPDLRNDLLWERKTNRVHALYRPMAGLQPLANATGSGDEGAQPTEEERAAMAADEARRRAMRNRTWAGVFPRPTAW